MATKVKTGTEWDVRHDEVLARYKRLRASLVRWAVSGDPVLSSRLRSALAEVAAEHAELFATDLEDQP